MSKLSELLKQPHPVANIANLANFSGDQQKIRNISSGETANSALSDGLEAGIRAMAKRWGYTEGELTDALAGAQSDPEGWLVWTERDERDFGNCATPADFAAQYARLRGLA